MIDNINHWSEIDWKIINRNVKNLRGRIYKARSDGNFRKLRNLQRLMLKSVSNILYSIRYLSSNSGRNTPGIDGFVLDTPESRLKLFYEILDNGYCGLPLKPSRRIYIKELNKLRPISIPIIRDRAIQLMVKNALEPEWEVIFEKGSYGFRPSRSIDDAVSRIWLSLNREGCRKWVIDADIAKCFDSISHKYLLNLLENFPGKYIIEKWLKAGVITRNIWLDSDYEGIPQGASISPLLCNITLHGLEKENGVKYTSQGQVDQKGRSLIRFADDMILMCHTKDDAELGLQSLRHSLAIRGLNISEAKTRIINVTEGFDFLGFNFILMPKRHASYNKVINVSNDIIRVDKKMVTLYVKPSRKGIKNIKSRLKEVCRIYSSNLTVLFIKNMNEIIRGYAQSKWYWNSSKTFSHLDHYVFILCLRWAKRRHPNKNVSWLTKKYFMHLDNVIRNNDYNSKFIFKFHWFKIREYKYGKMDKNPDNKKDWKYFDELRLRRLRFRPFCLLLKLDRELSISQDGICPICNGYLFNGEILHLHHIIPKMEGGKFTFENLVYIHQFCHTKIHNKDQYFYYKTYLYNYKKTHHRYYNKNN